MENESSVDKVQIMPPEAIMSRFGTTVLIYGIIMSFIAIFSVINILIQISLKLNVFNVPDQEMLSWISVFLTFLTIPLYAGMAISILRCSTTTKKTGADLHQRIYEILQHLDRYYMYMLSIVALGAINIIISFV